MPKVLISDKMDPRAAQIFRERGLEGDEITGKTPEELAAIIGDYDGLAIRSSTKVTAKLLDWAQRTLAAHADDPRAHVSDAFVDIFERRLPEAAAQAGVEAVGLDFKTSKRTDGYGNQFRYRAKVWGARGSEVAVAVRRVGADETRYEFVVADDGPGISATAKHQILEPFYQVDGSVTRSHGGVGLGLAQPDQGRDEDGRRQ